MNREDINNPVTLEEAYEQIQEGWWDRSTAKKGTRLASFANKALGGLAKVAGDTRLGRGAQELQQKGEMDVEEQRAAQLTGAFSNKLEDIYQKFKTDAQRIGVDIDKLAMSDFSAPKKDGKTYPALEGLSSFMKHFNEAKRALATITAPPPPPA